MPDPTPAEIATLLREAADDYRWLDGLLRIQHLKPTDELEKAERCEAAARAVEGMESRRLENEALWAAAARMALDDRDEWLLREYVQMQEKEARAALAAPPAEAAR